VAQSLAFVSATTDARSAAQTAGPAQPRHARIEAAAVLERAIGDRPRLGDRRGRPEPPPRGRRHRGGGSDGPPAPAKPAP
jgi:hypothetical protein